MKKINWMRSKYLFLILLCFSAIQVCAQIDDITFRRVSPPGGFSFQAVHTIKQDLFGYIWMGSFDGIIRYDSKKVIRFVHNPEKANGLPSDRITSIVIDKQNNIWVSTDKGLCLFNPSLQQFERVVYNYENGDAPSNLIHSIELDGNGNLWIADENFFGYLDKEKNQLIRITEGLKSSPRQLYNDEINRLWLGTHEGTVYLVLPYEKRVVKKIEGPGSLARTIFANNYEIWVGYETHGARVYDLEGNLKKHYSYSSEPEFDIKSASIRKIWRDTGGRIWIGSYHGLFLSLGTNLIRFNPDEYAGLPHNSIYTIFEDRQGGIWIGTWSGGVAYLHHADNKFTNYRHSKEPTSLSNNMVSSFAQTPSGELFVGTEVNGLNKFDLEKKSFQKIEVLETEGILNIKTMFVESQGGLWVGSAFKGLFYRPQGKRNFIHFEEGTEDGQHISSMGVYSFCKSDSGVWIGTNSGSIDFYNFRTNQISFISKSHIVFQNQNQNVRSLTLDSSGNLWIAATTGMYQLHMPSNTLTRFITNSISGNKIESSEYYVVNELSDGKIWMGSKGNGINIYNPRNDELRYFDANGLLKGKDVYGIIEGQKNDLWITSNDGLILYDAKEKKSRKFIITDGIQGNQFNPQAIFKDKDENIYFGGTNGFTQLKPGKVKKNDLPPNVLLNNIEVNNRKIIPTQLNDNIFAEIVFKPEETTLKINFSADNFLLPEKNKFMYRLSNYMDEWVEVEHEGSATFVNLPAGKYIFKVKACNNDGIWNNTSAKLPIVIKQYWYKSELALLLYVFAFISLAIIIIRIFLERAKLKKTIIIEKIERKHEDHLHEMKLRFFTNISHEFRTPLTLLNWPIKKLLESKNLTIEQHSQLETVRRNTNRLLQLINQIMDLRKVEKGQIKLNLSKFELVDFVNEIILNFSDESKSKNILFSFNHEKENFIIEADEDKLDKIIFNLLSNAFKFSPKNGKISVTLRGNQSQNSNYFSNQLSFGKLENEDFIEIQVIDDGEGIDSEDLPNIFDRFEQGKHKKEKKYSTGIGLNLCKEYTLLHHGAIIVQSTPGEGSRFSVRFPTRQKAQKILYESHKKVKNINSWDSPAKTNLSLEVYNEEVKILIVEDNEDLRKYMILFLQEFYSVLFAENGEQGLEILETHNVQLIVSDVMMPIMDGFEFCQKVKSQIETSHIPVILLTALSSAENTSTGLEKGADAYISKPFDENVLLSQIKNLLQQRKRIQESYIQKFISKQPIDIGSLDNYFLNKVNDVVEKNVENENFSVDSLATEMGFSRSQLHRKLKQISNHSTSEYITMVKIKKATTLLASKQYNIDEVAFKSGFNSHSYFNKCFKKIHNKSPKAFLKQL